MAGVAWPSGYACMSVPTPAAPDPANVCQARCQYYFYFIFQMPMILSIKINKLTYHNFCLLCASEEGLPFVWRVDMLADARPRPTGIAQTVTVAITGLVPGGAYYVVVHSSETYCEWAATCKFSSTLLAVALCACMRHCSQH
jgi:hypothetical protein